MADAKKCDRCKKYYDPHDAGEHFIYDCNHSSKMDLCLDCNSELERWVSDKDTFVTR